MKIVVVGIMKNLVRPLMEVSVKILYIEREREEEMEKKEEPYVK